MSESVRLVVMLGLAFAAGFMCCYLFVHVRHLERDHDETLEMQVRRIIREIESRPESVIERAEAELNRRIRRKEI